MESYSHYRPYLAQLFGEVTDGQLKQVFTLAEVLHFDAGQHLFQEGVVPSSWALLVNTFTRKHRYRLPKMAALLINSLTLNSTQKQEATKILEAPRNI